MSDQFDKYSCFCSCCCASLDRTAEERRECSCKQRYQREENLNEESVGKLANLARILGREDLAMRIIEATEAIHLMAEEKLK